MITYNALHLRTKRLETFFALKESSFMIVGVLSASLGLKGYLLPNDFLDGGVTGISLLVQVLTGIQLSILIMVINIPFIFIGYKQVSKIFAFKTAIAIFALSVCIHFIEFPIITSDKLLIAIFGGFFLGTGIGLCMRGGCVIDGTEVLAIYVSRNSSLTVGDSIMLFNVAIFGISAIFINFETAMYAMLTYLSTSKTVDFIIHGIEEYIGVTIISGYSDEIREAIIYDLGRGVTIYSGKRGFGKRGESTTEIDIIYTVITRLELTKLKNMIAKIDPKAFIIENSVKDTKGGMIKKRPLH